MFFFLVKIKTFCVVVNSSTGNQKHHSYENNPKNKKVINANPPSSSEKKKNPPQIDARYKNDSWLQIQPTNVHSLSRPTVIKRLPHSLVIWPFRPHPFLCFSGEYMPWFRGLFVFEIYIIALLAYCCRIPVGFTADDVPLVIVGAELGDEGVVGVLWEDEGMGGVEFVYEFHWGYVWVFVEVTCYPFQFP